MQIRRLLWGSQLINNTLMVAALVFVMVWGGCGTPASDETPSSQPSSTADVRQGGNAHAPKRLPAAGPGVREKRSSEVANKADVSHQLANRQETLPPSIPHLVLTGLASPQADVRLRALDYWDTKDANAPLDAVFEAMEDEEEAVRARATAIIEQRWAAEEGKDPG